MVASPSTLSGPKGRPPLRPCPDDFDVIFVEQGRVGCEAWYRASRSTINRWMDERGAQRLIEARAAFVAHQRANGEWITRSTRLVEHREVRKATKRLPIRDRRKVHPNVARHAAQHLRIARNGAFIVSPAGSGEWFVGSRRMSAAQMVDLAVSKGFTVEPSAAQSFEPEGEQPKGKPMEARAAELQQYVAEWMQRMSSQGANADLSIGANWQDDELPTALQAGGHGGVKG